MSKRTKVAILLSILCFSSASPGFGSDPVAKSRKEMLILCDEASRKAVKEAYLRDDFSKVLGITSWLAGEDPRDGLFRYALIVRIREADGSLYDCNFSSLTRTDGEKCSSAEVHFNWATRILEPGDDDSEDGDS